MSFFSAADRVATTIADRIAPPKRELSRSEKIWHQCLGLRSEGPAKGTVAGATFLVVCLLGFTGLLGIPVSFITGTLSDIVCAQGRPDFLLDPSLPVPLWWHLVIALAIVLILTVLTAVVYLTYRAVRWGLHWWCKTYC